MTTRTPESIRARMTDHIERLAALAPDDSSTALPREFVTASPTARAAIAPVAAGSNPVVSFVIVTYGSGGVVIDSLASLADSLPADLPIEVIVVDNQHPRHPTATLHDLALSTAGIRVVHPGANLGFGGGCDLGVSLARGRLLALVNPDVLYLDGWLEPLVAVLDLEPDVGIAAPVLLDHEHEIQEAGYFLYDDGQTRPDIRTLDRDDRREVVYSSAACWLLRRDEYLSVGGFDPRYHPAYYEDVDLALRIRAGGGHCVVVGGSRVVHLLHGGTPDGRPPDVTRQRLTLLDHWPSIVDEYPPMPADRR